MQWRPDVPLRDLSSDGLWNVFHDPAPDIPAVARFRASLRGERDRWLAAPRNTPAGIGVASGFTILSSALNPMGTQ